MTSQFCIVHFTEDDSVEVVPDFWIYESSGRSQCYWPKTSFPTKNVIRRTVPEEHWTTHKCRILGTFDDFDTARLNLNQAEISSDFPSKKLKTLGKRLPKRNRRYVSDDDSSDDGVNEKNTPAALMYNNLKLSTYKSSKNTTSNSSSGDEDKENKLRKSNALKLPAAFEDKNERVLQANVTPCEVLRKKSFIISTKSSQNQHNIVDEDGVRQGCSKDHRREEQRSKPLNPREIKSQITYIGETEFEKRVIRDLTKVKLDIQEIRDVIITMQQDILHQEDIFKRKTKDTKQGEEMENILPAFPLKTLQDWNELATLLSNNKVAREQLETMFSNRGGKNGGDLIRRILGTVFSPQLAVQFSWQGRKNNEKVEGSVVARTIFVATKHKFKIDDREIELGIINWFRRASERIPKNVDIEIVHNH
ncbi:uncharacterized protein LOC118646991 [Monomorium pharaonis]|uniref:uncharacterized protein LOC118646991 n=1 Tax=Monomorium pharaonis TaxID=307658 RepID=UPI0017461C7C|nr:uncharacterized protein LOC118646991 [Monomorium pharaonis]